MLRARLYAQGCVLVNSITAVYQSRDVVVLTVDTKSKYVSIDTFTFNHCGGLEIGIFPTDRTLNKADGDAPTVLLLEGLADSGRWRLVAENGRYGGLIVLVRSDICGADQRPEPLWSTS